MNEGALLEYRVSRLFFRNGYFTRTSLKLKSDSYSEPVDITDIDVLGIKYDTDFTPTVMMAECKSGANDKPLAQIIRLRGLIDLFNFSRGYLVKSKVSTKIKQYAIKNKITPLDYARLDELEQILDLNEHWEGSYAKCNYDRLNEYHGDSLRRQDNLKNIYWFLKIDFWSLPSHLQIKKVMNVSAELTKKCSFNAKNYELWLLGESAILLSLAILNFCNELYPLTENERKIYTENKMLEGLEGMTRDTQNQLIQLMQTYAQEKVKEACGKALSLNNQDLTLPLPTYTQDLNEVTSRIISRPDIAIHIPRFLDYFIYQFILADNDVDKEDLELLFPVDIDILAKMSKNIVKFMKSDIENIDLFNKLMAF